MSHASVSVIIPTFNMAQYVAEAIASAIRQQPEPLEIIVVDDGSTDETASVVRSAPGNIRYIYQPNQGAPAARNHGLAVARGEFTCFLDADDLWTEDKLSLQLAYLYRDTTLDIILGYSQYAYTAGKADGGKSLRLHPESWPALSLGAATIRASAFQHIGLLDVTLPYDDDVDWYLRAREAGLSMRIHPDVVQYYRRHETNATNRKDIDQHYFLTALKRSLDRRRQEGEVQALPSWFGGSPIDGVGR